MTEKATFGNQCSELERQNDIRDFTRKFTQAEETKDYFRIEDLIREGLTNDYPIPSSTDPQVIDIICAIFRDLI